MNTNDSKLIESDRIERIIEELDQGISAIDPNELRDLCVSLIYSRDDVAKYALERNALADVALMAANPERDAHDQYDDWHKRLRLSALAALAPFISQFPKRQEELDAFDAMERWGGSFVQALVAAWRQADRNNGRKLHAAFSEYFAKYAAAAKDGVKS